MNLTPWGHKLHVVAEPYLFMFVWFWSRPSLSGDCLLFGKVLLLSVLLLIIRSSSAQVGRGWAFPLLPSSYLLFPLLNIIVQFLQILAVEDVSNPMRIMKRIAKSGVDLVTWCYQTQQPLSNHSLLTTCIFFCLLCTSVIWSELILNLKSFQWPCLCYQTALNTN